MKPDALKRKLRQLKKMERNLRGRDFLGNPRKQLVWDIFFSTSESSEVEAKYPFKILKVMDERLLKEIVDEYFYEVYFQYYKENGISFHDVHNPGLLTLLGLAPDASIQEIKKRYRELAKRYHPDHGGDSERFIELVEIYEKLIENTKA